MSLPGSSDMLEWKWSQHEFHGKQKTFVGDWDLGAGTAVSVARRSQRTEVTPDSAGVHRWS